MDLAHNMCRTLPMSDRLWKANQGMKCLPKIRTCMWRLLLRSYVRRHVINITERCPYWVELESIQHMVLRCSWVKPFQFATFGIRMENRQPLFVSSWVKTISLITYYRRRTRNDIGAFAELCPQLYGQKGVEPCLNECPNPLVTLMASSVISRIHGGFKAETSRERSGTLSTK